MLKVLPFGDSVNALLPGLKPEHKDGFLSKAKDIGLILENFQLRRERVKTAYVASEQKGKIREAALLARTALSERRAKHVDPLQAKATTERERLRALSAYDAPKVDPVLAFLRGSEIRARLVGKKDFELTAMLAQAVKNGDKEFVQALKDAPRMFPTVPFEELRAIDDARIASMNPELAELDHLAGNYKSLIACVEEHVKEALREEGIEPQGTDGITIL
ncbi:MAG: hypothetical protein NTV05_05155 [Acidobacteria bacterium]|nr:hypothetical protein [Acidobacteriota bacterium]